MTDRVVAAVPAMQYFQRAMRPGRTSSVSHFNVMDNVAFGLADVALGRRPRPL